jgi:cytidine deaminase
VFERDELPAQVQELLLSAEEARKKAYAPYSSFLVGAAILLDNGKIIQGSNQENAAYPSGLCAERVAIFHAHATFPSNSISAVMVTAGPSDRLQDKAVPPCGSCRQVLAEFEHNQNSTFPIYFSGTTGPVIKADSAEALLPFIFSESYL